MVSSYVLEPIMHKSDGQKCAIHGTMCTIIRCTMWSLSIVTTLHIEPNMAYVHYSHYRETIVRIVPNLVESALCSL